MRIAFYAPLKTPTHHVPSGDRLMARQLLNALALAEHDPFVASEFRSYEGRGERTEQERLRTEAEGEANRLIGAYQQAPQNAPDAWFTYHLYYKAPDYLGPPVCDALDIPYIVAEPSFAPKRAAGPWSSGHQSVARALRRADIALCLTRYDMEYVAPQMAAPERRLLYLPPFIDAVAFASARHARPDHRAEFAAALNLPADAIWLISVAMMRSGDKLTSYRQLAEASALLQSQDVVLLVVGDGPTRSDVETTLRGALHDRVRFLGELDTHALAKVLSAADIYVWPAVGEAYGMALLEAQAAGLPVVAGRLRGVVDVVRDVHTGLLADADDPGSFAKQLTRLLDDVELRHRLGAAAHQFVSNDRTIDAAATILGRALDLAVELRT